MTLDELNAAETDGFLRALDGVAEHAPWVIDAASRARPFRDVAALHTALLAAIREAPADRRQAFLNGHPELSPASLADPGLTAESRAEQGGIAFTDPETLARLNGEYRRRHGIPFIVCVRRHTGPSILRTLSTRLARDLAAEGDAALEEVGHIMRLRLADRLGTSGFDGPGWLSTHVLNTARGRPAQDVGVDLLCEGQLVHSAITDADGRTPAPMLTGGALRIGQYELRFHLNRLFDGLSADPPYFDTIPVRFAVSEPDAHYHVPLLVSPFGYSTYRGS